MFVWSPPPPLRVDRLCQSCWYVCVWRGAFSTCDASQRQRRTPSRLRLSSPVYFCSSRALTRIDTFPSLPLILVARLYLGSVTVCPVLPLGESFFFFKVTSLLLVHLSITPLEAQNWILNKPKECNLWTQVGKTVLYHWRRRLEILKYSFFFSNLFAQVCLDWF